MSIYCNAPHRSWDILWPTVNDTCLRRAKAIKQSLIFWGRMGPIFPLPNLFGNHGYNFTFSPIWATMCPLCPVYHLSWKHIYNFSLVSDLRFLIFLEGMQMVHSVSHLFGVHGSNFSIQSRPVCGNSHTHLYAFTRSIQEPPFLQGFMAQSSTFVSQFAPV